MRSRTRAAALQVILGDLTPSSVHVAAKSESDQTEFILSFNGTASLWVRQGLFRAHSVLDVVQTIRGSVIQVLKNYQTDLLTTASKLGTTIIRLEVEEDHDGSLTASEAGFVPGSNRMTAADKAGSLPRRKE